MAGGLISLLVTVLILALIYWAVTAILGLLPLPPPFPAIINIILIVIICIVLINALMGFIGGGNLLSGHWR